MGEQQEQTDSRRARWRRCRLPPRSHPGGGELLIHTAFDYPSFMSLLGALFTISGGICLRGSLKGTPLVNTAFLAVGAVLGSIIGTTGASALLIRPLLRANEHRQRLAHLVVFFIFIVSNSAGLLTPLGDPPFSSASCGASPSPGRFDCSRYGLSSTVP